MLKKHIIFLVFITLFVIACKENKKEESNASNPSTETKTDDNSNNPLYQKGVALIANSDCLTCHKLNEKNIGPAYQDIANKYENTEDNINLLASKIIKGGKGVWGEVPMTPHAQISNEDASTMVKYIFLLKK